MVKLTVRRLALIAFVGALFCAAFSASKDVPTAVGMSGDGKLAAVGTENGHLYLVGTSRGSVATKLNFDCGEIAGITFSDKNIWLLTVDSELFCLDFRGELQERAELPEKGYLHWMSATSKSIAVGFEDYDCLYFFDLPLNEGDKPQMVRLDATVVAACRTGENVYWVDGGSRIHLIDLSTARQSVATEIAASDVSAIDVDESGNCALGKSNGEILLLDMTTKKKVWARPGWKSGIAVQFVSIDHEQKSIVAMSMEGDIALMSVVDGTTLYSTQTGYVNLVSSAVSNDHRRAIVISQHHRLAWRSVVIYDLVTKTAFGFQTSRTLTAPFWAAISIAIASAAAYAWQLRRGASVAEDSA